MQRNINFRKELRKLNIKLFFYQIKVLCEESKELNLYDKMDLDGL